MHQSYDDIIEKAGPPEWFDECGLPRYRHFKPASVANIYAREAALVLIRCWACDAPFEVAFSRPSRSPVPDVSIAELNEAGQLSYGDPPNVNCCPRGTYSGSTVQLVLEYWRKKGPGNSWIQDRQFERPIR
jgi:hypothetical protein